MKKTFGKRYGIKLKALFLVLLLSLPLFSQEKEYIITESELTKLETELKTQQTQLDLLNQQLITSESQLELAKTSLQTFEKETIKTKVTLSILFFTVGLLAGITAPVVFPGAFD